MQISPIIIEDELLSHQAVKDAVAVGLPDNKCGELPTGVIVLKPNANATEEELIKFANGIVL